MAERGAIVWGEPFKKYLNINKEKALKLTSTRRRLAVFPALIHPTDCPQDDWTFEPNRRGYVVNLANMWDVGICVVAGLHLGEEGGRVSPLDSSEAKNAFVWSDSGSGRRCPACWKFHLIY